MTPRQIDLFLHTLTATTQDVKWGIDHVYSVGGKMFAVMFTNKDTGKTQISFKVDDERFLELTDRPGFIPAPYLARAKWVQVEDASRLPTDEMKALLARSHALVAAKLTRKAQRELGLAG